MSSSINKIDNKTTIHKPLNRELIFSTAVKIADEKGIKSVTMREIASRLNVEAMSLYNHISNKDDILDGMVDFIIDQFNLPKENTHWREAMKQRAISAHNLFNLHPWVPPLLDSRESSGPTRLHYFEWVLSTLVQAGFSLIGAARAFSLIDSYIYGFSIQQMNSLSKEESKSKEEMASEILKFIPEEKYPTLHKMTKTTIINGYDIEADFSFNLDLILDGLERTLKTAK